jgi:hypothetical protein
VLIGGLAMLAAFFFLSGETDMRLWVILALGPILYAIATRQASRLEVVPESHPVHPPSTLLQP